MQPVSPSPSSAAPSRWAKLPAAPIGLALVVLALGLLPRVRNSSGLLAAFVTAAAFLFGWALLLWLGPARRRGFHVEYATPQKSHYIQAGVQILIYVYWGWYWRPVYDEWPQFAAQFAFLYAFDALLSWTRGRRWRLGFGPLPIVLSTNIFLWFRDDWFLLQFALVTVGALGKEFLRWERNGRRMHVFNPSAFPLAVASLLLITTGMTDLTWARSIATTVTAPPWIYLEIFVLGLVVQYFFSVTLVTLSAVATLVGLNLLFTRITGVYLFIDTNLPVPSFIGLHFLVTDPATSPRTNAGRIVFGALYGALDFALAALFGHLGVPTLYDKLLPIPFLNLAVPWIERLTGRGLLARFTRWESRFDPRRLNLAHMGCWIALFGVMITTGYIEAPHPGASIAFWKQAAEEGKPMARRGLLTELHFQVERNDGEAWNEMGLIYMEGKLLPRDMAAAAHCFGRGALFGSRKACANLVTQRLFLGVDVPDADLTLALNRLEQDVDGDASGQSAFLVGAAYESGRGRAANVAHAKSLYELACSRGYEAGCQRLAKLAPPGAPATPPPK